MDVESFRSRVRDVVEHHPVVVHNDYTRWFAKGDADRDEVRHLTVQFSVFSHLFVEAQLRKCINATSLDTYRAGKEILLNELGVTFAGDGSVDGGRFRFGAAGSLFEYRQFHLQETFLQEASPEGVPKDRFLAEHLPHLRVQL